MMLNPVRVYWVNSLSTFSKNLKTWILAFNTDTIVFAVVSGIGCKPISYSCALSSSSTHLLQITNCSIFTMSAVLSAISVNIPTSLTLLEIFQMIFSANTWMEIYGRINVRLQQFHHINFKLGMALVITMSR